MRYIAREITYARETAHRLVREQGTLLGFRPTTLRLLAADLAEDRLAAARIRQADDVVLSDLAGAALDDCIRAGALPPAVASQARNLGYRSASWDAVAQLRTGGISAADLERVATPGSAAAATAKVLARYEALLAERSLADIARTFSEAIAEVIASPALSAADIEIEPGAAEVSGLPLMLVQQLEAKGARRLPPDLDAPTFIQAGLDFDLVRAATPGDELRAALRSALAEGLKWDDIEISTTDADTYGIALASLAERLHIPFTLKEGVPLARTRIGRALTRFLNWLSDGLPADTVREMLEGGELAVPGLTLDHATVARAIRLARIGWGRSRYERAREQFASGAWEKHMLKSRDDELRSLDVDERRARLAALSADAVKVLDALLAITPPVPELGAGESAVESSAPVLARAALAWLKLAEQAAVEPGEVATIKRLRARLEQVERHASPTLRPFGAAMAALRQLLADLRAWPSLPGERLSRTALPGAVHLTDASHAGVTGRKRIFVLGLDADRTAGARMPDPILDDRTREALGGALLTTAQRAKRSQLLLDRALAGLTGRVTFSYAAQSDGAGREASPGALMLAAMRVKASDTTLSYDAFRARIGSAVAAVPTEKTVALDARDAWLGALASGPVTLDGVKAVRSEFPALARGFDVRAGAHAAEAGEWHGLVLAAAGKLGPLAQPDRAISPSSLERLAQCPLAWFYIEGLGIRPPDDVDFDAGAWLDALQRGSLLHEVFETFVTAWRTRHADIGSDEALDSLLETLRTICMKWRDEVPPPSELVYENEWRTLERLTRGFLTGERADLADGRTHAWLQVERWFPASHGSAPVLFDAGNGVQLSVRGKIDRIDELPGGALRVVDYKTGEGKHYWPNAKQAACNGGRWLQPAIYAAAAAQQLGRPVESFEYRFPRSRPPFHRVGWSGLKLANAGPVIRSLLEHASNGGFVATNDSNDCTHCDFGPVCRVRKSGDYGTNSPRAAWAAEHGEGSEAYQGMLARRAELKS